MKKHQKRLKNGKVISFTPDESKPGSRNFAKAFQQVNNDEPPSLGEFVEALSQKLNEQNKPTPEA